MKNSIIGAVILAICAVSLFKVQNYPLALLFVALAVLVLVLAFRKKAAGKPATPPKPAPAAPAPAAPSAPQPSPYEQRKARAGTMHFKIKGVTFEDRQTTLAKIDAMEDDDYIACTYGIALTEYEGRPAFRIYAHLSDDDLTEKTLGYVPKENVPDVLPIYDNIFGVEVDVYGGDGDKDYGAAATLFYDK